MKKWISFIVGIVILFFGCSKYDKQTSLLAGKDWVRFYVSNGEKRYLIKRFYPEGYYVYFSLRETSIPEEADIEIDEVYYKIYVNGDRYPDIEAPYYEWDWLNEKQTQFFVKKENSIYYYQIESLEKDKLVYYQLDDNGEIEYGPYEYEVNNDILSQTIKYNYKDYYKLFIEPALEEQTNN